MYDRERGIQNARTTKPHFSLVHFTNDCMSCITFTGLPIFIKFLLGSDLFFFLHTPWQPATDEIYIFFQTLKTPFNFETGIKLYPTRRCLRLSHYSSRFSLSHSLMREKHSQVIWLGIAGAMRCDAMGSKASCDIPTNKLEGERVIFIQMPLFRLDTIGHECSR